MEIKTKQDIVKRFGVHRNTFRRRYLPDLLEFVGMSRDDWNKLHNRVFPIFLSKKCEEWLQSVHND